MALQYLPPQGGVSSVAAGNASITVAGTAANPTVATTFTTPTNVIGVGYTAGSAASSIRSDAQVDGTPIFARLAMRVGK